MAKLVCYTVSGLSVAKRVALQRALYGYKDTQNGGKNVYAREGIASRIKFKKVFNGVIKTDANGSEKIVGVLRRLKVKNSIFSITD